MAENWPSLPNKRKSETFTTHQNDKKQLKKAIKECEMITGTHNILNAIKLNNVRVNPIPNINLERAKMATPFTSAEDNKENIEQFRVPRKTTRVPQPESATEIHTNNRFETLSDNMSLIEGDTPEQPGTSYQSNSLAAPADGARNNRLTTTRKLKPPPIYVYNSRIREIVALLSGNGINKGNFWLKQAQEDIISVMTIDLENYYNVINIIKSNKKEYYTFTPKQVKLKSIVLKGIRGGYEIEELTQELAEKDIKEITIQKISKLSFSKDHSKFHFIVQITGDSDHKKLMSHKIILNQAVTWQLMKRKNIFQCRNCQQVGHSSANCNLKSKCVKCGENHEPGSCALEAYSDKNLLRCANCKQTGHPASYRGCPYLKFAMDAKNKANKLRKIMREKSIKYLSNTIDPNRSFASVVNNRVPAYPNTSDLASQNVISNNNYLNSKVYNNPKNQEPIEMNQHIDITNINKVLAKFKDSLLEIITEQLNKLNEKINENSLRIDYILSNHNE